MYKNDILIDHLELLVKTEFGKFWKVSVVHWPKAKQNKMKIKKKKRDVAKFVNKCM